MLTNGVRRQPEPGVPVSVRAVKGPLAIRQPGSQPRTEAAFPQASPRRKANDMLEFEHVCSTEENGLKPEQLLSADLDRYKIVKD